MIELPEGLAGRTLDRRTPLACEDDATPMDLFLSGLRNLIRLYLSRFPLRDGKGRVYEAVQEKLLPSQRFVTARVRPGFRLRLDLSEPAQRKIYFFGEYDERHEIALLGRVLRPGDVFWDIGANIGFYSLTASLLVRPEGRVVAFEPAAHAWQALLTNLGLNHCDNVQPVQVALSDGSGQARLYRRADVADGGASLIARPGYHESSEAVTTKSLAQFLEMSGEPPPTFIKIDVEGLEARVLAGAAKILHGSRPPLVLVEMNDPKAIAAILQGAGYQGIHRQRRRWRLATNLDEVTSRNMLWFHPASLDHRERLAFLRVC